MNPSDLNVLLAVITNHFFNTLSKRDFLNLAIFLSLLSKDMLSMEAIRGLCKLEERENDHW